MNRRNFLKAAGLAAGAAFVRPPLAALAREPASQNITDSKKDLLSTPNALGSEFYRRHLVMPGHMTSYIIAITNPLDTSIDLALEVSVNDPKNWVAHLNLTELTLPKKSQKEVLLTVRPDADLAPGISADITIDAKSNQGPAYSLEVGAQTSNKPKLVFVSMDALHPGYLKLNAAGTGPAKPGDRLMPNLHRLLMRGTFYPDFRSHIISATDMNHFNILAGTKTGTAGIPLTGSAIFGFSEDHEPDRRSYPQDLNFYGPQGKRVPTLFTASKKDNPSARTAFISGKNWVPEMLRDPENHLDLIVHGEDVPDYIQKMEDETPSGLTLTARLGLATLTGILPGNAAPLGNPKKLPQTRDPRLENLLASFMGALPNRFPPDEWVMDTSIRVMANEDPDTTYILLAAIDDAGHAFGAAHDPEEWDKRGSENPADHLNKYDPRASRQGMLNVVRESDLQLGRLLDWLEKRGNLDSTLLVVESTHSMTTYYQQPLDMRDYLEKACPDYQAKQDFFFGAGDSVGFIYNLGDDPLLLGSLKTCLEAWKIKDPLTGKRISPVMVFDRQDMKKGKYLKETGDFLLPREYYSEHYIEHPKKGRQMWPDLLVLTAPHYKFKVQNYGLKKMGLEDKSFPMPEWSYFIGGHGSFATRPSLLVLSGPGIPENSVFDYIVYTSDIAPTIYRLMGWPVPDCVDGLGLPGIDDVI